jgi:TRAP-type C4-dicarboxylate transport system permease small subunit
VSGVPPGAAAAAPAAPAGGGALLSAILAVEAASRLAGHAAILCLVAVVALVTAEVVSRDALRVSLGFSWEYAAYAMTATFFLGAAETLRTRGHIRVGVLLELLGPRGARAADVGCTGLALAVLCFATYAIGLLAHTSWTNGARSWSVAQTPLAIPQAVITLGMALLTLQMLARLGRLLLGLAPDDPPPNDLQD